MNRRDRTLEDLHREWDERDQLPLGAPIMPATRTLTADLTQGSRRSLADPLELYRVLRGRR